MRVIRPESDTIPKSNPMSLHQTIAHYLITDKLGEGGMGAVYRATDTKLNRDVAIKVLPEVWAQEPDRLIRFQREAQVLACLGEGLSNAQIAGRLYLSEATVKGYVSRMLDKLGCANRTQAGLIAHDAGLVSP